MTSGKNPIQALENSASKLVTCIDRNIDACGLQVRRGGAENKGTERAEWAFERITGRDGKGRKLPQKWPQTRRIWQQRRPTENAWLSLIIWWCFVRQPEFGF
jgi:hypothetical protein